MKSTYDRSSACLCIWLRIRDINCSSHGCIENRKWMDKSKVVLIRSGKQSLDWLVSGPVLPEGGCTHEYTLLWISSVFTNDLGVAVILKSNGTENKCEGLQLSLGRVGLLSYAVLGHSMGI